MTVDALSTKRGGFKAPDVQYMMYTSATPEFGLLNLINLVFLIAIIDNRRGGYSEIPNFRTKVPDLLQNVWKDAGFSYLNPKVRTKRHSHILSIHGRYERGIFDRVMRIPFCV